MCGSMIDIQFRLLRLGEAKKDSRKIEITGQKYNGLPYSIGRPQKAKAERPAHMCVDIIVYNYYTIQRRTAATICPLKSSKFSSTCFNSCRRRRR